MIARFLYRDTLVGSYSSVDVKVLELSFDYPIANIPEISSSRKYSTLFRISAILAHTVLNSSCECDNAGSGIQGQFV